MSYPPPPPQPPGWYPPPQQPRRRRHTARNVILICAGALAVLVTIGIVGAALGGKTSSSTPPVSVNSPAATTAPATTTAPAAVRPRILIRFAGSGIRNSAPFAVGSGPLTVTYHFACSSDFGTGNFIADLVDGNGDSESIANDLAASGGQTTTVYPQDAGALYHLEVNSECSWRIRVTG